MCGPVIVIFIITIQITSNWPQYNDGLSQTCCFVWSCQMWLPLWCFGKRKKKRFAFEETALAVNWRAGTGGDISLYVCVCVCICSREREQERKRSWGRKNMCVYLCVCQQLFSNCSCWRVYMSDVCVPFHACVYRYSHVIVFMFSPESFGPSQQRNSISVVTHQSACLIPVWTWAWCVCVHVCVLECALCRVSVFFFTCLFFLAKHNVICNVLPCVFP